MKGTMTGGMFYTSSKNLNLVGYLDNDWGRDLDERKNTIRFVFLFLFLWEIYLSHGHLRSNR
jgi:hypothetical protein